MQEVLMFYTTHPDEATARRIAAALLTERLAACANIFPAQSAYWWQGTIQTEGEWIAVFKSRPELESQFESALTALHPYETPCVVRWNVRVNDAYGNWVRENCRVC